MRREIIGKVSIEEKEEVYKLFKRKKSLLELCRVLKPDETVLYEKLVGDLGDTVEKLDLWWSKTSEKYSWKSSPNDTWSINFTNCEISLISKD